MGLTRSGLKDNGNGNKAINRESLLEAKFEAVTEANYRRNKTIGRWRKADAEKSDYNHLQGARLKRHQ